MAQVVYALFESRAAAEPAVTALARRSERHEPFSIQLHKDRLDPLALPESATQVGRNNFIAAVGGGGIGLVLGVVGAWFVHVPGLTPASAGAIGLITGVLIGAMSALMSGARDPKPPIAALAPRIGGEADAVLVTVEVRDGEQAKYVEDLLDTHQALELGVC